MREIKFRAWDKTNKRIVPLFYKWELPEGHVAFAPMDHLVAEDFIPMQYTGFKDKNGIDIYEGDIVKAIAETEYPDSSVTSDIIFTLDTAFTVRSRDPISAIAYIHGLSLSWGAWESFEIIGNIYENPELLK